MSKQGSRWERRARQSVRTVGLLGLVHGEAEGVAIEADRGTIGASHMQRDKLGTVNISHGGLCRGRKASAVLHITALCLVASAYVIVPSTSWQAPIVDVTA